MRGLLHFTDGQWFLDSDVRPVRFHPYTTFVTGRVVEMPVKHLDPLDLLRRELVDRFKAAGIAAEVDNKTVFEVDDSVRRWFLGFYDLIFALGTSCRSSW
jgi:hypothetical protein